MKRPKQTKFSHFLKTLIDDFRKIIWQTCQIRFIFLIVLQASILCASQNSFLTEREILDSPHTPLTTIYGVPDTNILGVNVINGDYNYTCIDYNLPGIDPLLLQRSYCSSRKCSRAFYQGWTHNLSGVAVSYPSEGSKFLHVVSSGSLSGELIFKTEIENRNKDLKISRDLFKKGITNCGRREISGRTNIKNMKVSYSSLGIQVTNPDGTKHQYRRTIKRYAPKRDFNAISSEPQYHSENHLEKTTKLNGLTTKYRTSNYILYNVQTLAHENVVANEISFQPPDILDLPKMRRKGIPFAISSWSKDEKRATYFFGMHGDGSKARFKPFLEKFESNCFPSEVYRYTDLNDGPEKLCKRKGNHHLTKIEYYKKGDTVYLNGMNPEDVLKKHVARNRVKQIDLAVNGPEDLQTAFRFAYYKDKESKEAFTEVYNAYDHLTRFHYSTKSYRLHCIEKYEGNSLYSVCRRDRFKFGAKLTPLEGDLLYKAIEDRDGIIHYGESYHYDERGNVLKRKLHYRTLTDSKIHPIHTKEKLSSIENGRLWGGEVLTTHFTYNTLNLPTSEDNGRVKTNITYHDKEGHETNLIKSRLIQEKNIILKREFFEFDHNAACTLKIEDDGTHSDPDNLFGVKCRKIARFLNRQGQFAGLPLEVDLWGSNGHVEQRISRTTFSYDTHGYVDKEIHYDANNVPVYEIQKIRDIQGNIVCETDPLGQTTHRKFNEYGSLLEEQGPSLAYHKTYTYDWLQRPTIETRYCTDGIHLTTQRKYDLEGKITESKDPYGATTEWVYGEHGKPIKITYPPIRTENGWIKPCEHKQYNFLGHLV